MFPVRRRRKSLRVVGSLLLEDISTSLCDRYAIILSQRHLDIPANNFENITITLCGMCHTRTQHILARLMPQTMCAVLNSIFLRE